jgi:hypothetical protein
MHARIMQIQMELTTIQKELTTIQKGDLTTADYFRKMKRLADTLAVIGK